MIGIDEFVLISFTLLAVLIYLTFKRPFQVFFALTLIAFILTLIPFKIYYFLVRKYGKKKK